MSSAPSFFLSVFSLPAGYVYGESARKGRLNFSSPKDDDKELLVNYIVAKRTETKTEAEGDAPGDY